MASFPAIAKSRPVVLISTVLLLVSLLTVALPQDEAAAAAKALVDINPDESDNNNPNASTGGRSNGLSSVAGNNDIFYSATEWGGLFKTLDGGAEWDRLDGHRPVAMWDVEVDPGNTGTVYATSWYDGRTATLAGINVSYDGGATWNHPSTANPTASDNCHRGVNDEPSAFGIAIRPDAPQNVFIGTTCGVARSTDSGVTWDFIDPFTAGDANNLERVWDVVASAGGANGIVDICGDDGFFRSTDGGTTWTRATNSPAGGYCQLAVSPDENYVLYAAVNPSSLWESVDGNVTWTNLGTPDSSGRNPMVTVNQRSDQGGNNVYDVWFGDFGLFRATCTAQAAPGGGTRCPLTSSPAWTSHGGGAHADAADLVFDREVATDATPMIFASDGGVHTNQNTGPASTNWMRSNEGHHSLWLWGMSGGDAAAPNTEFLYGGTQDNGSFAANDAPTTMPPPSWTNPDCCDVFDTVSDADDVIYTQCCGTDPTVRRTDFVRADADMASPTNVNIPPTGGLVEFTPLDSFDLWGPDHLVLVTRNCTTGADGCTLPDRGIWITQNLEANPIVWTELGNGTEPTNPCSVQAAVTGGTPTFYVQAGPCDSRGGAQLFKYSGTAPNGTWSRIDNNDGMTGGIGIFAVDPSNPNRIYVSNTAPGTDGSNAAKAPAMMVSNDGGLTWDPDNDLDTLMTGAGDFKYYSRIGPTDFTGHGGYPQPTLLAFDGEDPNIIVAGGHDSGVFLSTNGGQTWGLMTDPRNSHTSGTAHLPQPRFAYFDHEQQPGPPPTNPLTDIYIGSEGRGFWRMTPASADLSITKTSIPAGTTDDPAIAGSALDYIITVTNDGPDTAPEVVVTDQLPDEVDYITDTDNCTETPAGSGDLTCQLGDIPSGQSETFQIRVVIHPDTVSDSGATTTTITNRAQVSSGGSVDPDTSNNNVELTTVVDDSADLRIAKVCEPGTNPSPVTQQVDCTIFVDNFGPSDAQNVVVTDRLQSDGPFAISQPMSSKGTCTAAGPAGTNDQQFTCTIGTLEPIPPGGPGGRVEITFSVTANEGQDFTNRVDVDSTTFDPDTSNNTAFETFTTSSVADLSITKSDDPDPVTAGESLTYTLTVVNTGPSTGKNVVVEDFLPAGVTIDSVSPANQCNAGVPGDASRPTVCELGNLADDQTEVITIVVTVDPQTRGELHNDARVSASNDSPDDNTDNNFVTISTQVRSEADLRITKSDSPDPVVAGEPLDYEIRVDNAGPSTAKNLFLEDSLSQDVVFLSAQVANGAGECEFIPGQPNPNSVECELNDLDPGQHVTVFISTITKSSALGSITNTATATSDEVDPTPGNATEVEETTVDTKADLMVVKTSDFDTYAPSATIQYLITVTNFGPSDARQVVLFDDLPETKQAIYRFDDANCARPAERLLECRLGTISAGEAVSFNVYVTVKGNKGVVTNVARTDCAAPATGTPITFDPDCEDNSSTRRVLIQGSLHKKGGGG